LNAATEKLRRCFFVIFQYLTWNLLPTSRQKLPIAQQASAMIGTISRHHRRIHSGRRHAAGNAAATLTDTDRDAACAGRAGDPLSPIANEEEVVSRPGNFFRIIDLKLSHFLNLSVPTHALLNPTRNIFQKSRLICRACALKPSTVGELQNGDRNGRRNSSDAKCFCMFV
jgi:hypothetical protein